MSNSSAASAVAAIELAQFEYLVQRFGRLPAYMTGSPIDNRSWQLTSVIGIFGSIAVFTVLLRFYVRIRYFGIKAVGMDDHMILAALFTSSAFSGVYIWGVLKGGVGRFDIDVELDMFPVLLKSYFIAQIVYHPAVALMKASICLYLLRIAAQNKYRVIIWTTLAVSSVYMFAMMIVTSTQCNYLKLFYHQPVSSCLLPATIEKTGYATSGFNIFTDLVLIIIPIPMLWNVQISKKKKIVVLSILSLGVFASIATIIRLLYLVLQTPAVDAARRIDYIIWSVIELNTGIIVANVPSLAPLVREFKSKNNSIASSNQRGTSKFGLRPFKLSSSDRSESRSSDLTDGLSIDDLEKEAGMYENDFKEEDHRRKTSPILPPKAGIRKTMTIYITGANGTSHTVL